MIARWEEAKAAKANMAAEDEDPEIVSRELYATPDKRYGMVVVKRESGGRVPKILQGYHLNMEAAEEQIRLWKAGMLKPMGFTASNSKA